MATVINQHKFSGLEQHELVILHFSRFRNPTQVSPGWNQVVSRATYVPFWRPWGKAVPLPFPASKGCTHSLAYSPFFTSSKPALLHLPEGPWSVNPFFSSYHSTNCPLLPHFSTFKDPYDYIRTTQIILDTLLISRPLTSSYLQSPSCNVS